MRASVIRKTHFNAAHRLHNPAWDDETNQRIFGKCNYPNYHGHNYVLEVKLTGEIDPGTGYVYDLGKLQALIEREVLERFDHKNLNLDTQEFASLIPSAENIAVVIWQILRSHLDSSLDLNIRLYETERNIVEFPA